MVQIIGLMVGGYILVRMLDYISRKEAPWWVRLAAFGNFAVTTILLLMLLGGVGSSPTLR